MELKPLTASLSVHFDDSGRGHSNCIAVMSIRVVRSIETGGSAPRRDSDRNQWDEHSDAAAAGRAAAIAPGKHVTQAQHVWPQRPMQCLS